MKSPFTGGPARFVKTKGTMKFRDEEFPYTACEWQCKDTGEFFAPLWGEDFALQQVHVQYAMKHMQPLPYQIKRLKRQRMLSDKVLSELSGIPEKDIAEYINGHSAAMPAEYDYSCLHAICSASTEHYVDYLCKTKGVEFLKWPLRNFYVSNKVDEPSKKFREGDVYHYYEEGVKTGFGEKCEAKLDAALVYVVKMTVEPLSQKDLEEELFFSDFISYIRNGVSITGLPYVWNGGFRCKIPFADGLLPDDIMAEKDGVVHLLVDMPIPNLDEIFAEAIDLAMHMPESIRDEVRNACESMLTGISFDDAITENVFVFARSARLADLAEKWVG